MILRLKSDNLQTCNQTSMSNTEIQINREAREAVRESGLVSYNGHLVVVGNMEEMQDLIDRGGSEAVRALRGALLEDFSGRPARGFSNPRFYKEYEQQMREGAEARIYVSASRLKRGASLNPDLWDMENGAFVLTLRDSDIAAKEIERVQSLLVAQAQSTGRKRWERFSIMDWGRLWGGIGPKLKPLPIFNLFL